MGLDGAKIFPQSCAEGDVAEQAHTDHSQPNMHQYRFGLYWSKILRSDALPDTNILIARLIEHVEEHGESTVMHDITGHIDITGRCKYNQYDSMVSGCPL